MNRKLTFISLFSGYDSQCLALDRLKQNVPGFDYELLAWCEIDSNAIKAHNILYPQWKDRNLGDISKCNWGGATSYGMWTWCLTAFRARTSAMPVYKEASAKGVEREADCYGSARKPLRYYVLKC